MEDYKKIEEEIKNKKVQIKELMLDVNKLEKRIITKEQAERIVKPIISEEKDIKKIIRALYICYPHSVTNALEDLKGEW